MERYIIQGGRALAGSLDVQGAKNSALPIMAACILGSGISVLDNVPRLSDVAVMSQIMETIGARIAWTGANQLKVDCTDLDNWAIPDCLMRRMRSSFIVVGPLLGRLGRVRVTYPGGCAIGTRAIDLHLQGLQKLGVEIITGRSGQIEFRADKLQSCFIDLDIPSVGATENILMAAVIARGTTVINNPAREPEIVDMQSFLNKMGAKVAGAGGDQIVIEGVDSLEAVRHEIIPDRIVAGTLLVAAAVTGGKITLNKVIPAHLSVIIAKLAEMGADIRIGEDYVTLFAQGRLKSVDKIITAPYPGFPTDMQPQFMAALASARGVGVLTEKIFDGRFKHIDELRRMGANISVDGRTAIIRGVERLSGASVEATDLRAGAALVIAALSAEGMTAISGVQHIDRGYVAFERQLAALGALISREKED
ncbi:MAG: UDP-N-acetylglucosamine 1-carboxyvinyltransferase [Eubacteriales bacterium]|nr:UDP-N-acetylglucosamine 1-carboxyvinyltransferase [Eubacteriales bacterium]MDD3073422.1 UDP-N-acetylglucosamine 1-carboxyvinyltransferase [Eubacteriales bacterium]MDD4078507.1 UDP-N-acetylglucosamine 1-carboxyvinyltransferase [Eubacteriales bacterium]MDD4768984.1 UDP-N-acetylglucosamine 1-carboxyvinyltransferase [Eubacteriales bacterium]